MGEYVPRHRADSADSSELPDYNGRLFPPLSVPSFYDVAGTEAAAEYTRIRDDLDTQEIRRRQEVRAARRAGRSSLNNWHELTELIWYCITSIRWLVFSVN